MYMRGGTAIAQDPNCGGAANIPAGQTVWLTCQLHQVRGAEQYKVEVTGVQFR